MKGQIVSRKGDQLKVQDSKSGSLAMVVITYDTKILRDKSKAVFRRHEDMDVNAMLPGRTISAEGVGDAKGQLEASKISFSPDVFGIQVAQEQQTNANKSAAAGAQSRDYLFTGSCLFSRCHDPGRRSAGAQSRPTITR